MINLDLPRTIRWVACLIVVALLSSTMAQDAKSPVEPKAEDFPEFELPTFSGESSAARRPVQGGDGASGRRDRLRPQDSATFDPVRSDSRDDRTIPRRGSTSEDSIPPRTDEAERSALPQAGEKLFDDSFDWTQQPLSIADIEIGRDWPFEHGKPNLTEEEAEAYVTLLRAVMARKFQASKDLQERAVRDQVTVNVTSAWESAFYQYEEVRRKAWASGAVRLQVRDAEPADPFSTARSSVLSTTDRVFSAKELTRYSMQADMQSHPAEFTGRPVVLYGLFTPSGAVELQAKVTLEGESSLFTLQRGFLRNLTDTETIAIVDAMGYVDPVTQTEPSTAWPVGKRVAIPVLIKGWFVKLWGQRPLLFTEVARVLTPRPYDSYVREYVRSKRPVSEEESWLYHETLRQLQVTSGEVQAGIALKEQQIRVAELLQDVRGGITSEFQVLENKLRDGTIPRLDEGEVAGFETLRTRLARQLEVRERRYLNYQRRPEMFPVFDDVFRNPERWHGRLVTLRGHVRRVITHAGDSTLFDGQPLHELWLFTDDSQNNPTVIVTASLPKDFPASADVIDAVTVTGCFFKMYVYRSQSEKRIAPLVLAGHVSWTPTSEQVLTLAKEGHLAKGSKLLAAARAEEGRSVSDTMVLLLGFLTLLATMTVWGRVLRDRRERLRLMALVDERPDFRHTPQDLYSGPFAEPRIEPTHG
jgi:hypothetical protein